jgi:hypothetical protein
MSRSDGSFDATAVKDAATIVASLAGVGYAIGFLVVTSSLVAWNISDYSIVQVRYISVGLLYLVYSVVVLVPAHAVGGKLLGLWSARHHTNRSGSSALRLVVATAFRVVTVFAVVGAVVLLLFYATSTDAWMSHSSHFWLELKRYGPRLFLRWLMPLFVIGVLSPVVQATDRPRTSRWPLQWRALAVATAIVAILVGIHAYAEEIYTRTTPAIGGGDYFLVKLMPGKDQTETLRGVVTNSATGSPKWIWLLDQTDKSYFVLLFPDNCDRTVDIFSLTVPLRAVEIAKSAIVSVTHYQSQFDGSARCN